MVEYPDDWGERRQQIFERDDVECRNCGSKGGEEGDADLHAHHVVPKHRGGVHDTSNLVTLCEQCHLAVHNSEITAPTGTVQIPYDEFLEAMYDGIYDDDWDQFNEFASRLEEATDEEKALVDLVPSAPQERSESFVLPDPGPTEEEQTWEHLRSKWREEFRRVDRS